MGIWKKLFNMMKVEKEHLNNDDVVTTTFSNRYFIDWKPNTPIKEFSNITCCNKLSDSDNTTFCKYLMDLNRHYTRSEIQQISARLGYSVFDNIGGTPDCCCYWRSETIVTRN